MVEPDLELPFRDHVLRMEEREFYGLAFEDDPVIAELATEPQGEMECFGPVIAVGEPYEGEPYLLSPDVECVMLVNDVYMTKGLLLWSDDVENLHL